MATVLNPLGLMMIVTTYRTTAMISAISAVWVCTNRLIFEKISLLAFGLKVMVLLDIFFTSLELGFQSLLQCLTLFFRGNDRH